MQGEFPTEPTIENKTQLLRAMTELAEHCISIEDTQIAAEILAFLLLPRRPGVMATFDRADDLFADLAGSICPRVILDAREFAADMDLATMIEYLRDVYSPDCN